MYLFNCEAIIFANLIAPCDWDKQALSYKFRFEKSTNK